MFTDKFISFPSVLFNSKQEEKMEGLGVDTDYYDLPKTEYKFNPLKLVAYNASSLNKDLQEGDKLDTVLVDVEGAHGAELLVDISTFEKRINEWYVKYLNANI
jgi:hypothetical protein